MHPHALKIYSVLNGFTPHAEVLSIEKSLGLDDPTNKLTHIGQNKADKNSETFVIA